MIYIVLSKTKSEKQNTIVAFLNLLLRSNDLKNKILYVDKNNFLLNDDFNIIDRLNDYVFFTPETAAKNIEYLLSFKNSIVVLEKPSILLQKLSKNNPINENLAINKSFKIMYVSNENDATNDDLRIVVQNETYVLSEEKFLTLQGKSKKEQVLSTKNDEINTKKEQIRL